MSHPFPHRYEANLAWEGGTRAALSSGLRPVLVGGPPPEFDGPPEAWSPEHLLLSAANLCLMTTFFALAKRAGLEVGGYRSRAEGVLDKTPEGLAFTRILLRVTIQAARAEDARAVLASAKKHCIVSNALRRPVDVEAEIEPTREGSAVVS